MIEVVAFEEVDGKLMKDLCTGIQNIFGSCYIPDSELDVSTHAYDGRKKQYESGPFLEALARYSIGAKGEKLLGVTQVDIFTPGINFIFGHAHVGGRICVISIHRLDPRFYGEVEDYELFLERCIKEGVHELGHTYGLGHCRDAECVMVFSNNVVDVDGKKPWFCRGCQEAMVGVELNDPC